jgi:ATP-dependent DNA ligase
VRLITKGGYDWTKRYPQIVEAELRNLREALLGHFRAS